MKKIYLVETSRFNGDFTVRQPDGAYTELQDAEDRKKFLEVGFTKCTIHEIWLDEVED